MATPISLSARRSFEVPIVMAMFDVSYFNECAKSDNKNGRVIGQKRELIDVDDFSMCGEELGRYLSSPGL